MRYCLSKEQSSYSDFPEQPYQHDRPKKLLHLASMLLFLMLHLMVVFGQICVKSRG